MDLVLDKIIENVAVKDIFFNGAYIYNFENNATFKTVDFENIIWENPYIKGNIISNGNNSILSIEDDRTLFIDDINGEILAIEEFQAYEVQLDSHIEKDYIFGYINTNFKGEDFCMDIGYFSPSEDEFIILKEQYDNGRIIWASKDQILFLKRNTIELLDFKFNKIWDLSFDKLYIQEVTDCFDYQDHIFIIANEGKVIKIDKNSGKILRSFQNEEMGDFYNNYFINEEGIILFLGNGSYMEISSADFTILYRIDFSEEQIFIKKCFFSKVNNSIYFFGRFGDNASNLIASFDLKSRSFNWKYKLEKDIENNYFFSSPKVIGDYIVAIDGLKNLYVFKKN